MGPISLALVETSCEEGASDDDAGGGDDAGYDGDDAGDDAGEDDGDDGDLDYGDYQHPITAWEILIENGDYRNCDINTIKWHWLYLFYDDNDNNDGVCVEDDKIEI